MAITRNPSKTKTIESNWLREIRNRYSSLGRDINDKLRELSGPIEVNETIGINASQQRVFMAWLLGRIEEVTGSPPPSNWQNEYQLQSYIRAVERTRSSLISQGADMVLTDAELLAAQGIQSFTAVPTLGTSSVAAAIHQDSLEFIFTRSYESLKGWNDDFAKDVRQITFDAVKDGKGIIDTTSKIMERTGVTKRRAELIARTETISAYFEGSMNEVERASEETGEEIKNRWLSALSPTTRHKHGGIWHGTIVDNKEVRKRRQPPDIYNCKCAIAPVIAGANDTPKKNAKFSEERKAFDKMEKDRDSSGK